MFQLILMLNLTPIQPALKPAQVEPCVWPNLCVQEVPVTTCQWPNTCAQETPVR